MFFSGALRLNRLFKASVAYFGSKGLYPFPAGRLERLLVMRLQKELADEELREQAEIEAQVAALRAAATKKAQMKKADLVAGAMGRRL